MGLMVYGTFGRSGVYPLQAVLRAMVGDRPLAEQISFTRRLLANLPSTNLFSRNPGLRDHTGSDAELVDLLLHSQDRSYTVEEIAGLLSAAGLNLISFIEPLRYEPGTYLKDPVLLRQLASLSPEGRAAVAEKLAGNMKTHVLYVSRRPATDTLAWPYGPEAIPCLRVLDGVKLAKAVRRARALTGAERAGVGVGKGGLGRVDVGGWRRIKKTQKEM